MQKRASLFRKLRGLAFVGVIISICYANYSKSFAWCIQIPTARIDIDGKNSTSQLYRKKDGQLIILLTNPVSIVYRIPPNRSTVYYSGVQSLEFKTKGVWDKRTGDVNPYGADLGYRNGVKVHSIGEDTNAKLIVRDNHIEFNGLGKERITVDW